MSFIKAAAEPPPGVIADLENPQDVLRTVNLVVQSLCIVFVSVTVLLRMYTRAVVQKTIYREDCKSSFYRSARVVVDTNRDWLVRMGMELFQLRSI